MRFRSRVIQILAMSSLAPLLLTAFVSSPALAAGNATTVGSLQLTATFVNISVYANFSDDDNGNNTAILEWRESGGTWKPGMALTVDRRQTIYDRLYYNGVGPNPFRNQWRGSVLGLQPDTEYEVRVTFNDPDGVTGTNPVTAVIRSRKDSFPLGTGNTYYVATTGSNTNPGTEALPWATLSKAASSVSAGDTVYFKAGTYNTSPVIMTASGTANNYITLTNYGPDNVIFNGGNTEEILRLDGASYVHIKQLNFTNAASYLVRLLHSSNYNVIDTCTFRDWGSGVATNGAITITLRSAYNVIQYNDITDAYPRGGTGDQRHRNTGIFAGYWCGLTDDAYGPGEGNIYRYNRIYDSGSWEQGAVTHGFTGEEHDDIQTGLYKDSDIYGNEFWNLNSDLIGAEGGSINCRVWGNILHDSNTNFIGWGPCKIGPLFVYRNTCYWRGTTSQEICIKNAWGDVSQPYTDYGGVVYCYNNTFYAPRSVGTLNMGVAAWGGHWCRNQVFKNNIFYDSRWCVWEPDGANNNYFDYNCMYNGGNSEFWIWGGTNYPNIAAVRSSLGLEMHGISADPKLTDPRNGNLTLQSSSPCINAGEVLYGFNDANSAWPYRGTAPDMGALEYDSGAPVNSPPVLASIGNRSVAVGQLLQFTISATDPNGDTLTYSASNLPSGSSFNAATKTFSWTPTANQTGTYANVQFQVSDGSLTDSETITITVSVAPVNGPPVLAAIGNKSVNAGQLLQFTISATDPNGDALTYSASNLPSGSSFNVATRTFSWTPTTNQVGTYPNVQFQVSDGSLSDSESITITVNAALPVLLRVEAGGGAYTDSQGNVWQADRAYTAGSWGFYGPDNTVDRGTGLAISGTTVPRVYQTERYGMTGYRFDVTSGNYTVILDFAETYLTGPGQRVFDVLIEGQTVISNLDVYAEAGANAALQKNFNVSVVDGQLNIDFVAHAELPEINGIEILSAGTNSPPVLAPIGNKSVTAGQQLQFTISATDPDGNPLTYSASNLPFGASFNAGTQTFSWTPSSNQTGTYANVHFEVSDGARTASENITITVLSQTTASWDVNQDGAINVLDMIVIGQHWGETGSAGWIRADVNADGVVNTLDSIIVGQHWTG